MHTTIVSYLVFLFLVVIHPHARGRTLLSFARGRRPALPLVQADPLSSTKSIIFERFMPLLLFPFSSLFHSLEVFPSLPRPSSQSQSYTESLERQHCHLLLLYFHSLKVSTPSYPTSVATLPKASKALLNGFLKTRIHHRSWRLARPRIVRTHYHAPPKSRLHCPRHKPSLCWCLPAPEIL
jgi:hypothetical protein